MATFYERLLREFMDVLFLAKMRNTAVSGYDMISYIHQRFNLMVSSGTVYSVLYSMERKGLIKSKTVNSKRVYTLTPKGEATVKTISASTGLLEDFMDNLVQA